MAGAEPTMRAARMVAPGRMEIDRAAVPVPGPGEVLVRMRRASICGSDVHVIFDGFGPDVLPAWPGFPGHEGVGEVVESRSVPFEAGDRVLTVPVPAEAKCFAEYQVLSERFVVPLPADGDLVRLLMAQQLGTTVFAFRRFWPEAEGAAVATLIGAGSAGLFFLQQLRTAGFERVIVADREPARLEVAAELGAATCVRAPHESVVEATMDLTDGRGADLVVEAAGYDVCRAQAVAAVREGGRLGFFGFPERHGDAPFPVEMAFRKSVQVRWAGGAQREEGLRSFHEAVAAILQGGIEVGYCLGPSFPLERLPEAMGIAHERGRGAVKLSIDLD